MLLVLFDTQGILKSMPIIRISTYTSNSTVLFSQNLTSKKNKGNSIKALVRDYLPKYC